MANDQLTINIPAPLVRRDMHPRDLIEAAKGLTLTDEETAALPAWAVGAISSPRDKSPKSIHDALMRLDYVRLEAYRAGIADRVNTEIGYRLSDEDATVLTTALPSGKLDFDAKRALLRVLREAQRHVAQDNEWNRRSGSGKTQSAGTNEAPATKAPAKKAAAKKAAAQAPSTERPALRAV